MRLIIDENVNSEIARFLQERGHDVVFIRDQLGEGMADTAIADFGEEWKAIIVTYDRDFKRLVERAPGSNRLQFRQLGRISLNGKPQNAVRRLDALIESIEFEHARVATQRDGRLIIEITETTLRIVR